MSIRSYMAAVIMLAALVHAPTVQAQDQKTSQSSGLKASIGKISVVTRGAERLLIVQLVIENTTRNRIYLFITGDNRASISDGEALTLREIIGLTHCHMLYPAEKVIQLCIGAHGADLNYYSYIDPGGKVDLSLRYVAERAVAQYSPSGSLSFRILAVSRFARSMPGSLEADADPKNITQPQVVILNFPLTPIN